MYFASFSKFILRTINFFRFLSLSLLRENEENEGSQRKIHCCLLKNASRAKHFSFAYFYCYLENENTPVKAGPNIMWQYILARYQNISNINPLISRVEKEKQPSNELPRWVWFKFIHFASIVTSWCCCVSHTNEYQHFYRPFLLRRISREANDNCRLLRAGD